MADFQLAKLTKQAEEQEGIRKAQEDIDKDLAERDAKVSKVENIISLKQQNQTTLQKILQEREKLAKDLNTHNAKVSKDTSEIEIREKGIKDDFKTLKEREEKLAKDQKKLEEDKKTYKEGIIKKIGEGVKV